MAGLEDMFKLYVGNLPYDFQEHDLEELFSKIGSGALEGMNF